MPLQSQSVVPFPAKPGKSSQPHLQNPTRFKHPVRTQALLIKPTTTCFERCVCMEPLANRSATQLGGDHVLQV